MGWEEEDQVAQHVPIPYPAAERDQADAFKLRKSPHMQRIKGTTQ